MGREIQASQEAWNRLAEKSRTESPFFPGLAVGPLPEGFVLKSRWTRWFAVSILFVISGLMYVGAYFLFELSVDRFLAFLFVLCLATLVGRVCLKIILAANKITLNRLNGTATIRWGSFPSPRSLTVSADHLTARLSRCENAHCENAQASPAIRPGYIILSLLNDRSPDQELVLDTDSRKLLLAPAFDRLRAHLPHGGIDQTIQEVELHNGQITEVSIETLTGGSDVRYKRRTLRILSADLAAFSRGWGGILGGFCLAAVMLVLGAEILFGEDNGEGIPTGYIMFGLIFILSFVIFGTAFGICWWRRKYLIADKSDDSLFFKAFRKSPRKTKPICRLSDIVAVQICSVLASVTSDESSWGVFVYEINVVLRRPLSKRINITAGENGSQIRSDAATFAEFLSVPLLDHS
jgi:hypothetical protein